MPDVARRSAAPEPRASQRARGLGAAALAVCAAALLLAYREVRVTWHGQDFASYWAALLAVAAGETPYDPGNLADAFAAATGRERAPYPFLYPPPFLLLVGWLAALPDYARARDAWFLVNAGLSLVLAGRLARWSGTPWPGCAIGVQLFAPTHHSLVMGQVNIALAILLLEGMMRASGPWLAVGAVVKVSPAAGLVVLAARRQWRSILGFVAVCAGLAAASLAVVPPAVFRSFAADVLGGLAGGSYRWATPPLIFAGNHGLTRLLAPLSPDPRELSAAVNALRIGILALLLAGVAREGRREAPRTPGMLRIAGGLGCVLVLAAPVAWHHHLVLTLPALAHAWRALSPSRRGIGAFAALYVALALPEGWWHTASYVFPLLGGPLSALKLAAVLALYGICVRRR